MKKLILLLAFTFATILSSTAQNAQGYEQGSLIKIGLLGPGIQYEAKLNNSASLVAETGVSFSFGYGGDEIGWLSDYAVYAGLSPRYYYNFDNRLADGKSVEKFSGNFISLYTRAYLFETLSSSSDPNQYLIGPTWGIQRNLGKGWYYNLQLGAGASFSEIETVFTPLIGINIGFQL